MLVQSVVAVGCMEAIRMLDKETIYDRHNQMPVALAVVSKASMEVFRWHLVKDIGRISASYLRNNKKIDG